MKNIIKFACILSIGILSMSTYAKTAYVDVNSPVDGPGTAWSNAFHTIQQGIIDVYVGADPLVLVSNGVYEVGETAISGSLIKTRVWLYGGATVKSVNGPEFTIIKGQGPIGDDAVRCVSIADESTLSGFTLTDGYTMTHDGVLGYPNTYGAGVLCYATNAVIENCIITNCISDFRAGGAYSGTLNNCKIVNNTARSYGGGAYQSILNNCTIADNSSSEGVFDCTLNNCIVWNNKWSADDAVHNWPENLFEGTFNNCCTFPMPTSGTGNITNNPQFVSTNNYHLETSSPCIDSGDNSYVTETTDLDGNERIYDGNQDGVATVDMGCYESIIKHTWYVKTTSPQSTPGNSWDTAFHNIQAAIDAAHDNDTVLVTNGIYNQSGMTVRGDLGNRVAINKAITVKSVNGPDETIIQGFGGMNGDDARRCAYVGTNAVLAGFTLADGYTRTSGIDSDKSGGGAWCEDDGVITNCFITGNSAYYSGGGVYGGTIKACIISDNSANYGGGACESTLENSLIVTNSTDSSGGGAIVSDLYNCTLTDNTAGNSGGGVYNSTLHNSIVWGNTGTIGDNWSSGHFYYSCTTPLPAGADNITTDPEFGTRGADAFQPSPFSDCIDGGDNVFSRGLHDIIGLPRILDSDADGSVVVDMGCYETINSAADSDEDGMPDEWEWDNGLNCVDPADADETEDEDLASNLDEYIAFTDPTDSNSYFCVTSFIIDQETTLYFESTGWRYYTLQSCSNLTDNSWADVPGAGPFLGPVASLTDTNQPATTLYYRVKVSTP